MNRVLGRALSVAALCCLARTGLAQDDARARFAYVGPMAGLVKEGAPVAPVSTGLTFTIVLADGGRSIAAGPYALEVPGAVRPLMLMLDGASLKEGRLSARAHVRNTAGAAVEGVRLDIVGAVETFRSTDDQGQPVLKTRPRSVKLSSPLSFGDIADGADNGQVALEIAGLAFAPDTTRLTVRGVVSGLRYVRTLDLPDAAPNGEIDVDSRGRVYVGSTSGNQVARIDPDGTNATPAAKLPDQCLGMAINPVTGEIAATCGNHKQIRFFTPAGDDGRVIGEQQGLDNYATVLRFDSRGALWANVTSGPWRFGADGKPANKVLKAGDCDLDSDSRFDIAPDGTLYVLSAQILYRVSPDGKTAKRIAAGPGYKLGDLVNPASCRVDRGGRVYVVEGEGPNGSAAARISVFDGDGRFIRAFGRGAKQPPAAYPDALCPAEVLSPSDVAFGPNGLVYVDSAAKPDTAAHVLVFQPF